MIRLSLALLLTASCLFAQNVMPRPGGVAANERFVYVLRGDQLFQFDADTLQLVRSVRVNGSRSAVARDGFSEPAPEVEVVEEAEESEPEESEEPEELVEEPLLRDAEIVADGAGGKFGGRPGGRRALGRREGVGRMTAQAIERGLEWLKAHQDQDGKWDADEFMKHDVSGEPHDGAGNPTHDVGVTGLALLAFLGDGSTMRSGPYRNQIKNGVKWLRAQQADNGLFGSKQSHEFIYDHAIATLAMVEAYGLSQYTLLKKSAQNGINYLEWHRNPYAVWRYQPRDNDNDTSVTTWCVMAYRSAQDFGLDVNAQAMQLAATWYDQMTDPATGRTGYTERGGLSSRRVGDHASVYPRDGNETMTSVGLFARFLLGQSPKSTPVMRKSADLVMAKPPRWKAGSIDHYGWFFGSMAMYQLGGRHWKTWSRHLTGALVKNQDERGSWDPHGVWGEDGGRVYSTALSTLTLQSYYRYTRLVR